MDSGQQRLQELGYKQELKRSMLPIGNAALCFSVVSIITGITPTFNTGLLYGGPLSIVYGWLIVSFFTVCIALSLAEICSAFPTSGGLYFWSYKLGGEKWGPFTAWMTGWFNIAGMWTATTSVFFSLALLLQVTILVGTGGVHEGGYYPSKYVVICIYGAILLLSGMINLLGVRWFTWLGSLAALCNIAGKLSSRVLCKSSLQELRIIVLAALPRQSASSVFIHFNEANGTGIHSKLYIFLLGLLMSQYSLLGYDSAAHMSEETKTGDKASGYGILVAALGSILLGTTYLLPLLFTGVNITHLLDTNNDAKGYAIAQLFYDGFKRHLGNGNLSFILLIVPCVIFFFCGLLIVRAGSRMAFAFSRDGALPFSRVWHRLSKREVPVNAVFIGIVIAFFLALPYLASTVAFQAMVSISTISISIAYFISIFLRVTIARHSFVPGPLHLGRFSIVSGWLAICWIVVITILFCLPVAYPVTVETLNYTPVALGGFSIFTVAYWAFSGRYWFQGPVPNIGSVEM